MALVPSYSSVHIIFPDQGLNLGLLHWQVDSYPMGHQRSPDELLLGALLSLCLRYDQSELL